MTQPGNTAYFKTYKIATWEAAYQHLFPISWQIETFASELVPTYLTLINKKWVSLRVVSYRLPCLFWKLTILWSAYQLGKGFFETKFLGQTFDSKLSFKAHIGILKRKCLKAMHLLRVVAHTDWGADSTTLSFSGEIQVRRWMHCLRICQRLVSGIFRPRSKRCTACLSWCVHNNSDF